LLALLMPGVMVAAVYYGIEWGVTGGRVWDAAFVAAAHVGRVHPGDWDKVLILVFGITNLSAGPVCLLAAAAFISAGRRSWILRGAADIVGTLVIGIVLVALAVHIRYGSSQTGSATFLATSLVAVAALPAALSARVPAAARGIDAILWACLAGEAALIVLLCRISAGAWVNYGIPATVLAAALIGRILSRILAVRVSPVWGLPLVLAPVVLLASSLQGVLEAGRHLYVDRLIGRAIEGQVHRPRASFFFASRPGLNRINGRLELVYDDWLYPVFESIGQAEPRSRWLVRAMGRRGSLQVVINSSGRPLIEGTTADLRLLGYRPDVKLEPYYFIWVR
jgi:hypothetical protein